jgi:hypothetical protein
MKKVMAVFLTMLVFACKPVAAAEIDCTNVNIAGMSSSDVERVRVACEAVADKLPTIPVVTPGQISEWGTVAKDFAAAIGIAAKELGIAANDFLDSPAGTLTAAVILWHVAGATIWKLVVGVPFLISLWSILFMLIRKYTFIETKTDVVTVPSFLPWSTPSQKVIKTNVYGKMNDSASAVAVFGSLALTAISCLVLFVG